MRYISKVMFHRHIDNLEFVFTFDPYPRGERRYVRVRTTPEAPMPDYFTWGPPVIVGDTLIAHNATEAFVYPIIEEGVIKEEE